MTNKTAIVTGATSGIGLYIAKGLAATYDVVIVARDPQKAAVARQEIVGSAHQHTVSVELADLASLSSVDALANRILSAYPQTALLINNAGVFAPKQSLSKDGIELDMAVNHIASFLLTWRLLPLLCQHAGARVVNVNSNSHENVQLQRPDFAPEASFSMMGSYGKSKLASMFTMLELASRTPADEVTFNAVHPGSVATNMGNVGGLLQVGWALMKPFLLSPQKGADTPVWAATAPTLNGVTGKYFKKRAEAPMNPQVYDLALREAVWQKTCELAHIKL